MGAKKKAKKSESGRKRKREGVREEYIKAKSKETNDKRNRQMRRKSKTGGRVE